MQIFLKLLGYSKNLSTCKNLYKQAKPAGFCQKPQVFPNPGKQTISISKSLC
jgi:hypothetical protein